MFDNIDFVTLNTYVIITTVIISAFGWRCKEHITCLMQGNDSVAPTYLLFSLLWDMGKYN